MAIISSHVLDSLVGTHASGIRVECYQRTPDGKSTLVFDVEATLDGRISEAIEVVPDAEYELVFHSADYYNSRQLPDDGYQIINSVVLRISMPNADANCHLPIMLSPHSYSVWWSGNPPVATA